MLKDGVTFQFAFFLVIVSLGLLMFYLAKKGKVWPLRKLPGVDAIPELVGRCAEMGVPFLVAPGQAGLGGGTVASQTIAAFSILNYIAGLTAEYGVPLRVIIHAVDVYPLAQEIVHEAYRLKDKAEMYSDDMVIYTGGGGWGDQVYVAVGMNIARIEKIASAVVVGSFASSVLTLLENLKLSGLLLLGGTARPRDLPLMIACCDHTLLAEELFAAGAYLSGDPEQIGPITAQDIGRIIVLSFVILGTIVASAGSSGWLLNLFSM